MNILFLSSWLPYPLRTGSSVTNYNVIKELSRRHDISLLSFIDSEEELEYVPAMAKLCTNVACVLREQKSMVPLKHALGLLSKTPRSVVMARSHEMYEAASREMGRKKFDCAIADTTATIEYVLHASRFPRIVFHHNVDSVIAKRGYLLQSGAAKRFRWWLTWRKAAAYERQINRLVEGHIMVSDVDEDELLALVPDIGQIEVIANGVDIESFRMPDAERQRNSIIFTGLPKYGANLDGLRYFCREVLPIVKRDWQDLMLSVTGDFSGQNADDLRQRDGVILTGYLDDIQPAIGSSWISVVPIRLGSGTRFKILEAMALGTPVVSTTVGAEGLEVTHEKNILIADEPAAFAKQVLRLREDLDLWETLSKNGRQLVEDKYDARLLARKFESFLYRVCNEFSHADK
jgi:glycosyltransferase involved in cell wall biosynthesis